MRNLFARIPRRVAMVALAFGVFAGLALVAAFLNASTATPAPDGPRTLKPGVWVAPGSLPTVKADNVADKCKTALAPLRTFMATHRSGLLLKSDTDIEAFNTIRRDALAGCSVKDWTAFDTGELRPWLVAKP